MEDIKNKGGRPKEKIDGLQWKNIQLLPGVIEILNNEAKKTPLKNAKRYIEQLCNDKAKKLQIGE